MAARTGNVVDSTNPQTPAEIVVTRGPRAGTVNVVARRGGTTIDAQTFQAGHAGKRHAFAKKAGVTDEALQESIDKALQDDPAVQEATDKALQADAAGNQVTGPVAEPFRVTLRGMHQPRAAGRVFSNEHPPAALYAALSVTDYPAAEPVVEWEDTRRLAVLDLDYHDQDLDHRPHPNQLRALATQVRPRPAHWWVTHGRGLRLVYPALVGFAADELAACAALSLRALAPTATAEVLARTRHPRYPRPGHPDAGPVVAGTATAEIGELARWLGREADEALVQEWLAAEGLERGRRYAHDHCPVDPQAPSHGEPVLVGEAGVTCFKCQATGITLGSNLPGFFPYAALAGGGIQTRLRTVAGYVCHWEHAQHVIAEDVGVTGALAARCYKALLKALHGPGDPRVEEAFRRGRGLVRMEGYWATADLTRAHARDGLRSRLAVLPAVRTLVRSRDGEALVVNGERLGIFRGVDDLAPYGYPAVRPVRGMKIFFQWRGGQQPEVVRAVVLPEFLGTEAMRASRPRYVPARKRMRLSEAEAVVGASFPGVNHHYLRLLIAARGCAEGGLGQPPMVAVDGPSGAGKTTTVSIAAALIGDEHVSVALSPHLEHFHQNLLAAANSAGLVSVEEIIKTAEAVKNGDVVTSLNALLTFTRGSLVRAMYTGPVRVGQVPAIVITDIAFPPQLLCDEQLGRRFAHVHLERRVDWEQRIKDIPRWRAESLDNAAAANAIVSHVIDEFFASDSPLSFREISARLGFGMLNQGGDTGLDPTADLLALFEACCSPDAVQAPPATWKGRGWKLVRREGADRLSHCWQVLCDNTGDGFVTSRRAKETDWARLLGLDETVECDLSPNGKSALAVRFRVGSARSKHLRVNEEIRNPPPAQASPEPAPPPPAPPLPAPPSNPGGPEGTNAAGASSPAEAPTDPAKAAPGLSHASPPEDVPTAEGSAGALGRGSGPGGKDMESALRPIFLDIETRSALNLAKAGGRRYAQDASTEILTVVALIDNRLVAWAPLLAEPLPKDAIWPEAYGFARVPVESFAGPDLPPPVAEAVAAGRPFCAHNADGFDRLVWRARGLPEPAEWQDTLPHARAACLPGKLDTLGERLFGRGKDKEGKALVKRLSRPNRRGEFLPFSSDDGIRVMRYNAADVLLLAQVYPVVYGHAEPDVLAVDRTINERGVHFDDELARALIRIEVCASDEITARAEEATGGVIKATDLRRRKLLRDWLGAQGVLLPDLKQETIQRRLAGELPLDPAARLVLEARLAVNRISTGKLEAALAAQDQDGRLRGMLVYHKATTGRWAARGMQPHNLPRPHRDLKDMPALVGAAADPDRFRALLPATVDVADAISGLIRPTLRAATGKVLAMGDFSSVEARGVAWCAAEEGLLARFSGGEDVYLALAQHIFGRSLTRKDDQERQIGKQAILGCGYGMGAPTFAKRCAGLGIDLAAAGTSAEAVVEGYRDAYPKIAGVKTTLGDREMRTGGLWKDVEAAARQAILTGTPHEAGRCTFLREGTALLIRLPSGRRLTYRNARIEQAVPAYCHSLGLPERPKPTIVFDNPKKLGSHAYGGLLVENMVQAICRDLLVAAILECERRGLPVVLHVHDEIVVEVPAAEAEASLRQLALIMSRPPGWATGFPVEVEAYAAERYFKGAPNGAPVAKARDGQIL
jgi:DNA polymerase